MPEDLIILDTDAEQEGVDGKTPAWALGLMAAALVLFLAGTATLSRPSDQTSTTEAEVIPFAPIDEAATISTLPRAAPIISQLPVIDPVPLRILAVQPGVTNLVVLDLETAQTTSYSSTAHSVSGFVGSVMTPNRSLLAWSSESVYLFRGLLNTVDLAMQPSFLDPEPPIGLAPLRVIPNSENLSLWLVQLGSGYGPETRPTVVELRSMESGERLRIFQVDGNRFPVAAMGSGLVLNGRRVVETDDSWITEPGSERVTVLFESDLDAYVGEGSAVAASNDVVVRLSCPQGRSGCDLSRINELVLSRPDGGGFEDQVIPKPLPGTWFATGGPSIPMDSMPLSTVSPDGSMLLIGIGQDLDVNENPDPLTLFVVDLIDGSAVPIAEFDGVVPLTTWSHDGKWIVLIDGSDVRLINMANPDSVISLPDIIPDGYFVMAAG